MGKGDSPRSALNPSYVRAEEVRLARRIESLEIHRRALDRAIEPFGDEELDETLWRQAFLSSDPGDVVARNGHGIAVASTQAGEA